VEVGLTLVEPFAEAEVKLPGVMEMLVAPAVDQLSELLAPEVIVMGAAENELMAGLPPLLVTVTVAVAVTEPALLVAVNVYVVVAVGLTLVEPLAAVEVKVPGVIETLLAPVVDQLRVALPELKLAGFAENEPMAGAVPCPCVDEFDEVAVAPPQLVRVTPASRIRTSARTSHSRNARNRRWFGNNECEECKADLRCSFNPRSTQQASLAF